MSRIGYTTLLDCDYVYVLFTISVPQGSCPLVIALRRGALEVLGRLKPLQTHPPPCNSRHLFKLHHLTVCVCVYYCRTYDKAVCGGGGGQ